MREINGKKWSMKSFDEYKTRLVVKIKTDDNGEYLRDIYTEESDSDTQIAVLNKIASDKGHVSEIMHRSTKESDDLQCDVLEGL